MAVVRPVSACLALALLAGCASLQANRAADCDIGKTSAARADSPPDLSGSYRLVMTATAGHARGGRVRGTLTLARRPGPQPSRGMLGIPIDLAREQPFFGTASISLRAVGAVTMGTLASADPLAPGAAINVETDDHDRPVLALGLGSERNDQRSFIMDGALTEMRIRRVGPRGFSGGWTASSGYTTYHAAGTFCAVRTGRPDPRIR